MLISFIRFFFFFLRIPTRSSPTVKKKSFEASKYSDVGLDGQKGASNDGSVLLCGAGCHLLFNEHFRGLLQHNIYKRNEDKIILRSEKLSHLQISLSLSLKYEI